MKKTVFLIVLFLGVIIFFLLDFRPADSQGVKPRYVKSTTTKKSAPYRPKNRPPAWKKISTLTVEQSAKVYAQLHEPDTYRVKCEVPEEFADGVYRSPLSSKSRVLYGLVQKGVFTALVSTVSGEIDLTKDLMVIGKLRWDAADEQQWTQCNIATAETIEVSGTLVFSDGEPASNHLLNTCTHGQHVVTDTEGRFSFSAPKGRPCWLIGIVDSDQGLGRGKSVPVETHEDASEVEVVLPDSRQLLTDKDVERFVVQLYNMNSHQLDGQKKRLKRLKSLDTSELSATEKQALEAMIEEQQWVLDSLEEMDQLTSGDTDIVDKAEALRRMFFQDYH